MRISENGAEQEIKGRVRGHPDRARSAGGEEPLCALAGAQPKGRDSPAHATFMIFSALVPTHAYRKVPLGCAAARPFRMT